MPTGRNHFATLVNQWIWALSIKSQHLGERQLDAAAPDGETHTTHKQLNQSQIRPLDATTNFQENQRTEEHGKLYHGDTTSKIQTIGNSTKG